MCLIASVPEGDDKPYKYPGIYRGVDALIINKIDLLPYVPFDMDYFRRGVEMLNPGLVTFPLSCRTGEGLEAWIEWLAGCSQAKSTSSVAEQTDVPHRGKGNSMALEGVRIHVSGIVQGVGFPPVRLRAGEPDGAGRLGAQYLRRVWISNWMARVKRWNPSPQALSSEAPALAHIDELQVTWLPANGFTDFRDRPFGGTEPAAFQPISPDVSICRGLPARAVRPARPALPLPVHQLHQLRAALHHHPGYPL